MPPSPPHLRARWGSWREGRMLRPVLTLVTGSAAAQAIVFAAQPVLTRLFLPEAFGVLTVVTTSVAVLSTVASGGYRAAILLPQDDDDRAHLLALTLAVAFGSTALTLLGVALVVGAGLVEGAAALGLWWLAPALVLTEAAAAAETWHTGRGRFRAVSWARVAQSVVAVGVRLGVGLTVAQASDWSAGGLVGGAVAGLAAGALVSVGWMVAADGAAWASLRVARIRRLARRYVRFPSFSAPAALLNVASTRVPVFALVAFYGEAVVGQFGLAYGTLALPLGLVGGAVGQAFFPEASAARHDGRLGALTRATARGLWAVTAYPALAAAAAGPTLFAFVFGPEWVEAGQFAQRIAPWILLASVAPPLTAVFDVLERQRDELSISVLMFVVQTVVMVGAGLALDAPEAVLAAGVTGTVLRAVHLAWIFRAAGVPLAGALGDSLGALVRAAPFAAAVFAADRLGAGGAGVFAVAVVAGLAASAWAARAYRRADA
ncbi:MAG: oligosaccharide flippase family protein [Bacteroidota bacterium]